MQHSNIPTPTIYFVCLPRSVSGLQTKRKQKDRETPYERGGLRYALDRLIRLGENSKADWNRRALDQASFQSQS